MTPTEVRGLLNELDRRLGAEVALMWRAASVNLSSNEFRALVIDAYPEIVTPYAAAASELGVEWYDSAPSTTNYQPVPGDLPSEERLTTSASWALNTGNSVTAVGLLQGSATRALFDGLRETVLENVDREPGARWARHASANACGFCKMIATRHVGPNATFYSSASAAGGVVGRGKEMSAADRRDRAAGRTRRSGEGQRGQYLAGGRRARGNQSIGDKYHDNCHCIAVMVRPGQNYTPPSYVDKWNDEYIAATKKMSGPLNPNEIARLMDPH
ncbi:hypothetical protein [Gordonia alkanivorans]|uniref:VG15 protein n=1 Tax=Gordonia alkanivorans TaxID=84096 RepID=UPI0024B75044|nr:hypothetical protein [Gordonia alkanivorans]MDJ0010106.1 hypothetical protein [Gordonia alkanivorans]MDJ0495704.1 hypothetical protein [Gordonia alkanivorans]